MKSKAILAAVLALAVPLVGQKSAGAQGPTTPDNTPQPSIVSVPGVLVGHFTYKDAHTGCTVVMVEGGAVGGVDVRGGAPGTVETDLLDPVNTIQRVNAVLLAGGSAFGLAARQGVTRYLEERGEGVAVGEDLVVPIVPGAIIFDLRVAGARRPDASCGYEAARAASSEPVAQGNVGAGAGASLGKLWGMARAVKGGVGSAAITLESGLVVGALVVVNAVGDVVDPGSGQIVAGVRAEDGSFADARRILREQLLPPSPPGQNTTIAVVATNAILTKAQATKVAQMAHDGMARAITPAHTPSDGDAVFTLTTGTLADGFTVGQVGALAAEILADAIVRAALAAHSLPGLPAARDLPGESPSNREASPPSELSERDLPPLDTPGRDLSHL